MSDKSGNACGATSATSATADDLDRAIALAKTAPLAPTKRRGAYNLVRSVAYHLAQLKPARGTLMLPQETLAARLGVCKLTIQRAVTALREDGVIRLIQESYYPKGMAAIYKFTENLTEKLGAK